MPADDESLRVFQRLVKAVCNIYVTHFSRYDARSQQSHIFVSVLRFISTV
ncbi:hypothetical protein HMPREF0454_04488 [Hafnia alvei ATCC 51873]|uniref:Uncharacterized protein n=1 Tax=Hafnia alvei ATCC 51873 TaxID=1002364 RepID=G9YCZ4_HAFAL|nr:hypothetical protein HMPREF0454_04488 [Hafnia alvei ATCC 51873]